MTALVLAALVATSAAPARTVEVRVSAGPNDGSETGLANALAQALVDAGLPARRSFGEPAGSCREGCVLVSVREAGPDRFLLEVRAEHQVAQAPVRLAPSDTSFDRVHALAIEVELLAERVRARRRAPATPPARTVAEIAPSPAQIPTPASTSSDGDGDDEAGGAEELPDVGAALPPPNPSGGAAPQPALRASAPAPAPPPAERLGVDVAATMLVGTSGGLFMHGSTVGARVRLAPRLDLRAAIAFLRPQNFDHGDGRYHLELLPLQAAVLLAVPRLPGLRAGAGVETYLVTPDEDSRSSWSMGPIAKLEHRLAIRSFALLSSVQAALHPRSWSIAGDPSAAALLPTWTLSATLGLAFTVL
jgi:hypothetical protein